MIAGYITGFVDAAGSVQQATFQVGTLNLPALGGDYYDLYTYSDQGMSHPNPCLITRVGSPDPIATLMHQEYALGYGAGASGYLYSQVSNDENYLRYPGLMTLVFSLIAGPSTGSGSTAINGIEIVGYRNVPEPSSGLAVLFGAALLAFRRKRTAC